jgi:hypothetical protein
MLSAPRSAPRQSARKGATAALPQRARDSGSTSSPLVGLVVLAGYGEQRDGREAL